MYYFAYGSNMSSRRLQLRVPSARKIGTAVLASHALRFHKACRVDGSAKCDAVLCEDGSRVVHGVVFEIAADEKGHLDRVEGPGYALKDVQVTLESGDVVEAYLYYATDIDPSLRPWRWYRHHVLAGALEHALPESCVEMIRSVTAEEDPDQERHRLELAIYDQCSERAENGG